jgi:hypothetical protein
VDDPVVALHVVEVLVLAELRAVEPVLAELALVLQRAALDGLLVEGQRVDGLAAGNDVVLEHVRRELLARRVEEVHGLVRRREDRELASHELVRHAALLERHRELAEEQVRALQAAHRVHDGGHADVAAAPKLDAPAAEERLPPRGPRRLRARAQRRDRERGDDHHAGREELDRETAFVRAFGRHLTDGTTHPQLQGSRGEALRPRPRERGLKLRAARAVRLNIDRVLR